MVLISGHLPNQLFHRTTNKDGIMGISPESVFRQSFMANCFFFFGLLPCARLALAATSDEGKSRSLADHIAAISPF